MSTASRGSRFSMKKVGNHRVSTHEAATGDILLQSGSDNETMLLTLRSQWWLGGACVVLQLCLSWDCRTAAAGIWTGGWFFLTGLTGLHLVGRHPLANREVATVSVMSIVGIVLAVVLVALSTIISAEPSWCCHLARISSTPDAAEAAAAAAAPYTERCDAIRIFSLALVISGIAEICVAFCTIAICVSVLTSRLHRLADHELSLPAVRLTTDDVTSSTRPVAAAAALAPTDAPAMESLSFLSTLQPFSPAGERGACARCKNASDRRHDLNANEL